MPLSVIFLLLTSGAMGLAGAQQKEPRDDYKTTKSVAAIEKCLTEKLSRRGQVTSINTDGITTLMFREDRGTPMLIDLAPASVKVTTKFAYGTRHMVEGCL